MATPRRIGEVDRLAGLRRIGIDEVAYRKGQRYLTVVFDHDTGRLVWAGTGRDKATVAAFFDALGGQRAGQGDPRVGRRRRVDR